MTIKKSYIVLLLVAALVLGAIGSYIGVQMANSANGITADIAGEKENSTFASLTEKEQQQLIESAGGSEEVAKILQAYQMIQENYVEEVEDGTLTEGAIEGMLDTLEDPYSSYMDIEEMEHFNESIESSFEGIGAEVSMVEDKVTIVAPIKDSPAEAAGLKPNDQVLKVDGESIEGLDLMEAVSKIRGEQGSTVTLEIKRPGVDHALTIDVTRDTIPLETVYSETKTIDGKKAGIIEITSFSEKTAKRFEEELTKLENEGIEGLVLDVRGNPGGLFTAVEDILKHFVPKEKPMIIVEDRNGERTEYFSEREKTKSYPVTVLIDEGSASASEILAGALKEAAGAEVLGTTSFGKGTVQQTVPMGDGSTVKLTMAKWLTPDGNWIHEKGVKPTQEVKQPDYFYTSPLEIEEPLELNQKNDKIKTAQVMLNGAGYQTGQEDGTFTEKTKAAVEQFQADQGLEVTGKIDADTAEKLETVIIEKIRSGEHDRQKEQALKELF